MELGSSMLTNFSPKLQKEWQQNLVRQNHKPFLKKSQAIINKELILIACHYAASSKHFLRPRTTKSKKMYLDGFLQLYLETLTGPN
jgi:hypothetical protein